MKEKDVLHKPFPYGDGYALFAKDENDAFVKVLFSSQEQLKRYLNALGYDWGNEGKDEFTNFDCELRLLKVLPELSEVETVAADPQWEISEKEVKLPQNSSNRTMEDVPDAVELREVDHPIGHDDRTHASEDKDYSELWNKVNAFGPRKMMGMNKFNVGDIVENVNPDCDHFGSQGEIIGVRQIRALRMRANDKPSEEEDELGCVFAYRTINEGMNWMKGDILEKTPDQLELMEGMRRPW